MNRVIEYCLLLSIILLSGGCEAPSQDAATTTGGIEVRLIWPSAAEWQSIAPRKLAQPRSNMPAQVQTVRFRVTAPDMTTMQKDFPAADRRGEISGVPSGSNRRLTVQALDAGGALLADCVKAGLLVEPGKTTQTGDCRFQVVGGGAATRAIEPEMVSIAAGCFDMGSPDTEDGRYGDETLHNACVDAFKMGKYEVTNAEYAVFLNDQGRSPDRENQPWVYLKSEDGFSHILLDSGVFKVEAGFEDHPMIGVSWFGATAYAEWLARETGKGYRLPTEAEWEYAARAGTTTPYSFGSDVSKLCDYGNGWDRTAQREYGDTVDAACDDGYYLTAPAGHYKPNPWGLYDMHGNVWEWTCSEYVSDYDGNELKCLSKNDASSFRVLRGGSWFNSPRFLRSATRDGNAPDYRSFNDGFRVAQDL